MSPQGVVVIAIALAACGSPTAPSGGDGTVVQGSVAVSPAGGATGVPRGDTVQVQFEMAIDSASCLGRFSLQVGDSSGAMVPGHMTFQDGYRRMLFVPDSMLGPMTHYFAHMRDSLRLRDGSGGGMMGGRMGGGRMMTFDTLTPGAMRMGSGMGWGFTTGN